MINQASVKNENKDTATGSTQSGSVEVAKLPAYKILGYKYRSQPATTKHWLPIMPESNAMQCGSDPDNTEEAVYILGYN